MIVDTFGTAAACEVHGGSGTSEQTAPGEAHKSIESGLCHYYQVPMQTIELFGFTHK